MSGLGAVLLAAGRSSRFGTDNKLLAELGGEPMVRIVADALTGSACFSEIVVVTGHDATAVEQALENLPVRPVFNADWKKGVGSSIAFGVSQLTPNLDGAAIVLGDMPFLNRDLIQRLTAMFDECDRKSIVFPTTPGGEQRNPVIWPRELLASLVQLCGQEGGKALLCKFTRFCVTLPLDGEAAFMDVDDPRALQKARDALA